MRNSKNLSSIEEKNPYLAFKIAQADEKLYHFPIIDFRIEEGSEVLLIEGLFRLGAVGLNFLANGGKIVFIEKDPSKIKAYISLSDFSFDKNIYIFLDEEYEYPKVGRVCVFKKIQVIGKLYRAQEFLNGYHIAFSDYADLGRSIFRNIQSNLLRYNTVLVGCELKNSMKGKPIIICGSGPSLDESYEFLKSVQDYVYIFAAGSAILKLIDNGIKIDAGFLIDPWPPFEKYKGLKNQNFILFYQNRACEKVLAYHAGPKIWMGHAGGYDAETYLINQLGLENFYFEAGANAGSFCYETASFLGFDTFIFLGMDGGLKRDLAEGVRDIKAKLDHREQVNFWGVKEVDRSDFQEIKDDIWKSHLENLVLKNEISRQKLKELIEKFNSPSLKESIDTFLENIKDSSNIGEFNKEKVILEAEFATSVIYQYFISPLWNLFLPFYETEDKNLIIGKALFALEVLKFQQKFYFYPNNTLYFKDAEDGFSEIYFPSGSLKSRVYYESGVLNGIFEIQSESGALLREGFYKFGKKDSVHYIRDERGNLRLKAEFNEGIPSGEEIRKNSKGVLVRSINYQNENLFDSKEYDLSGNLKRSSFLQGEFYYDQFFKNGEITHSRKGKIEEGKIIWE
jgi:antitoxin component YwqK of YwqJK toxin-antitoxin module